MICLVSDEVRRYVDERRERLGLEPWPWEDEVGEFRQCAVETCRKKLAESNKSERCFACQNKGHQQRVNTVSNGGDLPREAMPRPALRKAAVSRPWVPSGRLCAHGCGLPAHRGRCKPSRLVGGMKQLPQPPAPPAEEIFRIEEGLTYKQDIMLREELKMEVKKLDTLKSEIVDISSIPPSVVHQRQTLGRQAELWAQLRTTETGKAVKVFSRDRAHATQTISHMRKRAGRFGKVLNERREDVICYLWLTDPEAK